MSPERFYEGCYNDSVKPCLKIDFLNKRLLFDKMLYPAERRCIKEMTDKIKKY